MTSSPSEAFARGIHEGHVAAWAVTSACIMVLVLHIQGIVRLARANRGALSVSMTMFASWVFIMQISTTETGGPNQSVQSAQTQWAELAVIAKRVVGDNHLVHANAALAIALRQVMSAVLLPDPQYNKGSPGHYKIDELCSWSGKLPDGRTVALEGHCIALTPAGKPRPHPVARPQEICAAHPLEGPVMCLLARPVAQPVASGDGSTRSRRPAQR